MHIRKKTQYTSFVVVTCAFYFDDKLLDEIIGVQSLIVLSMWEHLPAYVLKSAHGCTSLMLSMLLRDSSEPDDTSDISNVKGKSFLFKPSYLYL